MEETKDQRIHLIETIPEPVSYAGIEFDYPGEGLVSYTDCWEVSVYRFLHLIFSKDGLIQFYRLNQFMEPKKYQCELLNSFFKQYPVVKRSSDDYETAEGLKERAAWAVMLNSSKCLYLKRKKMEVVQIDEGGVYEVAATIENLFEFFANFFPKI